MYGTFAGLGKMNKEIKVRVKYPTNRTQKETCDTGDILLNGVSSVLFQLEQLFKNNRYSHG